MTSPTSPSALARVLACGALAAAALTGCSAGTSSDTAAPAPAPPSVPTAVPTTVPTTVPTAAPPPAAPAAPAAPAVRQLTLTVAGGTVTGDTGTVPVELGEPVRLTVTSDVADEVHVHGVDVSADVTAGGTVTLDFVQEAPGRFEVELEKSRKLLTRLQVS